MYRNNLINNEKLIVHCQTSYKFIQFKLMHRVAVDFE